MTATITWLGHSAFRLVLPDQRVIYIDPWLSENPACPDSEKKPTRCDFIAITHGHFDHVGDCVELASRFNSVVVANYDLCSVIESGCDKGRFEGMNTGGTIEVEGVRFSLTRAYHSSGVDTGSGPAYGGMPNGVVIAAPGVATLYHAGDTDVFTDMTLIAHLFAPKIAILPIGDRFTMGAKGAALAADLLRPQAIIPCHYKTFPILAQTTDAFREALTPLLRPRLHTPNPGQPLTWTADGVR
jgi:L-ascorbate metabolism protein UlaG (beta-lactamase superfamily)